MTTYAKIRAALYAALPLLVFYGVLSEQSAALWAGAVLALVDAVLAIAHIDKGSDDSGDDDIKPFNSIGNVR